MPVFSNNPFERAAFTLQNLVRGDAGAAARGMAVPNTLSPEERQDVATRYLGKKPGVMGTILDIATNPLVVVGAVLSMRYPVATAERLLSFGPKIAHYAKAHMPGMLWLSDFRQIFGEPLSTWFEYVGRNVHKHQEKWRKIYGDLIQGHVDAGNTWSKETGIKIAAYLGGLDKPEHKAWQILRKHGGLEGSPISIKLSGGELKLAEDIRAAMRKHFFRDTVGHRGQEAALLRQLKKQGVHIDGIKEVRDYWPMIETVTARDLKSRAEMRAMRMAKPGKAVSARFRVRRGAMLPSPEDLEAAGLMSPELEAAYSRMDAKLIAAERPPMRRYGLDVYRTLEAYTRQLAHTKAWNVPTGSMDYSIKEMLEGSKELGIRGELSVLRAANPVKANMLVETYIPLMRGEMTAGQLAMSARFSAVKEAAATVIGKLPIPDGVKSTLIRPLKEPQSLGWQKLGSQISGYLYNTTLAFNVVSPMKNLLQNVITLGPTIGVKATAEGMAETLARYKKFLGLRRQGIPYQDAFQKTFREFWETGFDITDVAPSLDLVVQRGIGQIGAGAKAWEAFQKKGLTMFTASERFNRASAFYGAYRKAMRELPGTKWRDPMVLDAPEVVLRKGSEELEAAAMHFGERISKIAHYGGGPLAAPSGIATWWPPIRQYMQFPLRTLGFALGPGTRMGGEGAFNPGTLGRMLVGSGVAYEAAKGMLGTDVSGALMFGAVPQLGERDRPFGMIPLVSPFLQIAGETASAVVQGDIEELERTLPLLVPGGVQAARMSSAAWPGLAKEIGRPYADYDSPTEEGKIPLYTKTGSLQGYYSPTQLWAKAVGLGDISGTTELALLRWLMAQRERIRDYRRKYVEAMTSGDYAAAEKINAEYRKAYPGIGGIQMKKSDVRAVQLRREVPRLERIMETLPPEMRPMFAMSVAVSMGARGPGFFGTDPSLFGTGTVRSRSGARPYRAGLEGLQMSGAGGDMQGSVRLHAQMGEQRRDALSGAGFKDLAGFLP